MLTLEQRIARRALGLNVDSKPKPKQSISLTDYKYRVYKHYQHAPHLEALDWHLTQVSRYAETQGREGIGRLIVEMPPRHGKTVTTSRLYPTWHLGRNPDHRLILLSYGSSLSRKNSRYARNLISSARYQELFPNVQLAAGSSAADAWDLAGREGGMDAMGFDGAATGKGAHILDIDDPVKNREQAESEVWRDRVWDAFTDDLYSRLEPGGAVIVQQTRWHMDDLAGRCLREMPGIWTVLRFPAVAEADDPLGRAEGDALWPARYPIETLRDIEATMGPYSWAALYQQNPVPAEGGIFKRDWFLPFRDEQPPIVQSARYWDLAMSEKTSADFTAGVKIGQSEDGHYYVLDVARKRVEWGDLTEYMAQVMLTDGPNVAQGIEEKGYMSRAVQELNADDRLHNYQIWGYPVDKDKVTRALPIAAKFAAGLIHVLNRHWTEPFVEELCSFDKGEHDDQVDAAAGAWSMLGDQAPIGEVHYGSIDSPSAF